MNTVTLGMTGLKVAPIAFGTWQLAGEWGEFDEQQALAAIRQARELGVNPFDTAQGYGFGASEQLLGRALRDELDKGRDDVVIATKGGLRMTDDGLVRDASPNFLRLGVEDSLGSLGVDYIDTYQVHWPDPGLPSDVQDHLIQVSGLIDSYRELLRGATDLHMSTVNNEQAGVMKQLAVVGTVFLPLSFITGFFGMNFGWLVNQGSRPPGPCGHSARAASSPPAPASWSSSSAKAGPDPCSACRKPLTRSRFEFRSPHPSPEDPHEPAPL